MAPQLFIFSNSAWTENSEKTSLAKPAGRVMSGSPACSRCQSEPDPILAISGHGLEDISGSACKRGPYDQVFTRLRD